MQSCQELQPIDLRRVSKLDLGKTLVPASPYIHFEFLFDVLRGARTFPLSGSAPKQHIYLHCLCSCGRSWLLSVVPGYAATRKRAKLPPNFVLAMQRRIGSHAKARKTPAKFCFGYAVPQLLTSESAPNFVLAMQRRSGAAAHHMLTKEGQSSLHILNWTSPNVYCKLSAGLKHKHTLG